MQKSYNSHYISYISQSISTASVPFSLFWNPSICVLQRLTVMPCCPILSLIESTRSVKPLLPSRSTSLAGPLASVVDVGFPGSDEDARARKAQEPIRVAAATFGEVEGHRPLRVGPGLGRDAEAKGRSEGTNDVDEFRSPTGLRS